MMISTLIRSLFFVIAAWGAGGAVGELARDGGSSRTTRETDFCPSLGVLTHNPSTDWDTLTCPGVNAVCSDQLEGCKLLVIAIRVDPSGPDGVVYMCMCQNISGTYSCGPVLVVWGDPDTPQEDRFTTTECRQGECPQVEGPNPPPATYCIPEPIPSGEGANDPWICCDTGEIEEGG